MRFEIGDIVLWEDQRVVIIKVFEFDCHVIGLPSQEETRLWRTRVSYSELYPPYAISKMTVEELLTSDDRNLREAGLRLRERQCQS